jgi:ribosome recycling factor
MIRIVLPMLTEERRKEIVKKVKGESETAKVAVRNIRKEVNESIKQLQKNGLPEDEAKSAETQVQKNTDGYIKKIDELTAIKEAEIMHV